MSKPPDVIDIEAARTASDYWDVLARIVPIAFVGGIVAVCVNLLRIMHEHTILRKLCTFIAVISIGCVSAGVAALGIELFVQTATPEIELLFGAIAGSSGQRIFDMYAKRLFGVHHFSGHRENVEPNQKTDTPNSNSNGKPMS